MYTPHVSSALCKLPTKSTNHATHFVEQHRPPSLDMWLVLGHAFQLKFFFTWVRLLHIRSSVFPNLDVTLVFRSLTWPLSTQTQKPSRHLETIMCRVAGFSSFLFYLLPPPLLASSFPLSWSLLSLLRKLSMVCFFFFCLFF